ncbi:hypothetical protein [Frankia sp. Cppng1_Ct_nod]|uniref:hypothetical protein n=1 Tax=Frankia sp. Cppng1_Ct_nod TaxID=2897162 RepID=UPI0010412707|nr:hypothetical protein [Frankia sp. Cppng1_Ct_nod]
MPTPDSTRIACHHPNRPPASRRAPAPLHHAMSYPPRVGSIRQGAGATPPDAHGEPPVGYSGSGDHRLPIRPATTRTRRFHVYDSDGEVLGSFNDWDTAHAWAHRQATDPTVRTPLDVEDRQNRVTRRVHPGQCEFIAWETVAHLSIGCEHDG